MKLFYYSRRHCRAIISAPDITKAKLLLAQDGVDREYMMKQSDDFYTEIGIANPAISKVWGKWNT